MKQRVQREAARSNASVLPYEKGHSWSPDVWCKEGELLKRTRKGTDYTAVKYSEHSVMDQHLYFIFPDAGDLHRTKVSVYINRKSQVEKRTLTAQYQIIVHLSYQK